MDLFSRGLKPIDLAVYLYMLSRADQEGQVDLNQGELSEVLSVSRSTISRAINSLKDASVVEQVSRGQYKITGFRPALPSNSDAPVEEQRDGGQVDPNSRRWAPELPSALTYDEERQFQEMLAEIETIYGFFREERENLELRGQLREKIIDAWRFIYPDRKRCTRLGWYYDSNRWRWAYFKTIASQTDTILDLKYNPAEVLRGIRRELDYEEYEPIMVSNRVMGMLRRDD